MQIIPNALDVMFLWPNRVPSPL